ncbi:hypothetical protein NUW58_g8172 [Xylaria curta]|uniref:Uncharacterized protein n=1 Tax=Xylaria curta TaxID=42375 RepID=A0ACC1NCE6_9PEZI|nr:hypothetical protein NUW58_g8172 [Xylaria curta]
MFLPGPEIQERQGPQGPCPNGNGTVIGDQQQFIVHCNTRFRGDEVFRQKTGSLAKCVELCASFQRSRCEGAQFKFNRDCVLIANLIPEGTRPSRFFDSAAAVFPQPGRADSCFQQGASTTFSRKGPKSPLRCSETASGRDLERQFQKSLESCLAACRANPACDVVTYDPRQAGGFKNCYLKTAIDTPDTPADIDVDPAVPEDDANKVANSNTAAVISTSTSTNTISTITRASTDATPQTTALVTAIADFGTAPTSIATASSLVPVASIPSTVALADSAPEPSRATSPGTGNGLGDVNNGQRPNFGNAAASNSSNAWIAAPVISGIAVLTLILAVFLWRRHRQRNKSPLESKRTGAASRATVSNLVRELGDTVSRMSRGRLFASAKTRLEDSDSDDNSRYGNHRGEFRVVSGSGRRLGFDGQEIPSTGPGSGSTVVPTGGNITSMSTISVQPSSPIGPAGLRDSQNGLRQNRLTRDWLDSQPGIPPEFRGPNIK